VNLPAEPRTPPELMERLQRYARYVALVAEQLEALRGSDAERARQLSRERQSLEKELQLGEGSFRTPDLPRLHEVLQIGLTELESSLESDDLLRERWQQLNDETMRMARKVNVQRIAPGRYLKTDPQDAKVDVRL
jgi:hypothetical protein